jgi:MFS transporter, FHS family, L-fucose permease
MSQQNRSGISPIFILGSLFFIFGFVTWLNGALIPYLKIACQLNNFESLLVTFAFYISYFVMALPSSWVLKKTGFRKGMMYGLIVMAIGALIFIPAAMTSTYGLFLTGLFVIGTGLSILQTASNPYITIVGPIESAAKRISIMGICNKIAGVIAPVLLSSIVLADADALVQQLSVLSDTEKIVMLDNLANRAILPYFVMTLALAGLSLMVYFSPLPEIEKEEDSLVKEDVAIEKSSVFSYPNLVIGVIALFLYVGAEVISADTIGNYGHSQGIPLSAARYFTAYTLAAMVVGYIAGIFAIPKYISQQKALAISAVTGILFTLVALNTSGFTSVLFIALLGLANALMWPAIWPLAIDGTGRHIKTASALLIMAIAGGALLPLLYGSLADISTIGLQKAYYVLIPCYAFILYYSVKGWKLRSW